MVTLYEIKQRIAEITARLLDAEELAAGEVTDETLAIEAELYALEGDRAMKLGGYLAVADDQDALAVVAKERAAYLMDRARAHAAKAEKLRNTVRLDMLATEETKLACGDYTARIQAGREAVTLMPDFMPWAEKTNRADLLRVKKEPDKVAIKAAIKAGEQVPGAAIVRGEPSLVIPRAKKKNETEEVNE